MERLRTSPSSAEANPLVRLKVLGAVGLVIFAVLVLRLWSLQILDQKNYASAASASETRVVAVPAPRGLILDRRGEVLVGNVARYEMTLSLEQAHVDPQVVPAVAALLKVSPQQVSRTLTDSPLPPFQPTPIATALTPTELQYFEEHASEFPGVQISTVVNRSYPAGGAVAPNVLGYVGSISAAQLAANLNAGYSPVSQVGKAGVESYYEPFLRGRNGTETLVVDPSGTVLGVQAQHAPTPGSTLVLNLDASLQVEAERDLAAQIALDRQTIDARSGRYPPAPNGAVVVLDPRSGAVLALASYPGYNLNEWVGGISEANYQALESSGALTDYSVDGQFTPGSTFKMITAVAALRDGLIGANTYVSDPGSFTVPNCVGGAGCTFHDDETQGNGDVNLTSALTKSSDVYFYNLGYLFWAQQDRYGKEPIQKLASAFGLDGTTGIDLSDETYSRVDSPSLRAKEHAQYPKAYPEGNWYTGDNIEMAFGQGGTVLTPLGLANAYATFANGGTRFVPEVAAGVVGAKGQVLERYLPKVAAQVPLPPAVRNPILAGLEGVVQSPEGTAYGAFKANATYPMAALPVAGKTGTASNQPGLEPNSWFVGFAPANAPRYVVLCVIDQGGYGAMAAAPVVAKLFTYLYHHPVAPAQLVAAPSTAPRR